MQKARGCEEPAPHPVQLIDGEMLYRCPASLITEETKMFMILHHHYLKGHLPVAGGLLDQTTLFVQAMTHIDGTVDEVHFEEHEKLRKQSGRRTKTRR